jgi:hypothetical protein
LAAADFALDWRAELAGFLPISSLAAKALHREGENI